jgi:hypothetical protein
VATKTYIIHILIAHGKSGESDLQGEYYGDFYYTPEGDSWWILLAETSDNSPWKIYDENADHWGGSGPSAGTPTGANTTPESIRIVRKEIELPTSATFIEVKASLKEYDPTVLDADEDLGTSYLKIPISNSEQKSIQQGTSSTGIVTWTVNLISKEYYLSSSVR